MTLDDLKASLAESGHVGALVKLAETADQVRGRDGLS
jgi:hypothetical protein